MVGTVLGALFQQIQGLARREQEFMAIGLALSQGIHNENELTNLIFFLRDGSSVCCLLNLKLSLILMMDDTEPREAIIHVYQTPHRHV